MPRSHLRHLEYNKLSGNSPWIIAPGQSPNEISPKTINLWNFAIQTIAFE